jgi:hypothetical protein
VVDMKVLHEVVLKRDARMVAWEKARVTRTEGDECRIEHGQAVCASGKGERVVVGAWRFGGLVDTAMLSNEDNSQIV